MRNYSKLGPSNRIHMEAYGLKSLKVRNDQTRALIFCSTILGRVDSNHYTRRLGSNSPEKMVTAVHVNSCSLLSSFHKVLTGFSQATLKTGRSHCPC